MVRETQLLNSAMETLSALWQKAWLWGEEEERGPAM